MRILHLEDDPLDAQLVRRAIQTSGLDSTITLVTTREAFLAAIEGKPWDVVLADNALPTFTSRDALQALRERQPATPLVVLSGSGEEAQIVRSLGEGAADYVLKDHLPQLVVVLHRLRLAARRAGDK